MQQSNLNTPAPRELAIIRPRETRAHAQFMVYATPNCHGLRANSVGFMWLLVSSCRYPGCHQHSVEVHELRLPPFFPSSYSKKRQKGPESPIREISTVTSKVQQHALSDSVSLTGPSVTWVFPGAYSDQTFVDARFPKIGSPPSRQRQYQKNEVNGDVHCLAATTLSRKQHPPTLPSTLPVDAKQAPTHCRFNHS